MQSVFIRISTFSVWINKHVEMHVDMCGYGKEKKGTFSSCENRMPFLFSKLLFNLVL